MSRTRSEMRTFAGILLDERTLFTLREVCSLCDVHADLVVEMVEEGVIEPLVERRRGQAAEWRFTGSEVVRAQRALRLVRDLRLNWAGAALALELLEELRTLRRERTAELDYLRRLTRSL